MKLGVTYIVFDGEELLEYSIRSIRKVVDFVCVVYQTISHFGNQSGPGLEGTLNSLLDAGLVDSLVRHHPIMEDVVLSELRARQIGQSRCAEAGCTHHLCLDVDEMFDAEQFGLAKEVMEGDYDSSVIGQEYYFKEPTWRIHPNREHFVSFIHPISTVYDSSVEFPFRIDITRQLNPCERCRVFSRDEVVMHHMSYVRKDISKKMKNGRNGKICKPTFIDNYHKYQLGDLVRLPPDFFYHRTVLVDNKFNIDIKGF